MSLNKPTTNSKGNRTTKSIHKTTDVDERKAETQPETPIEKGRAPKTTPQRVEIAGKQRKGEAPRQANKPSSHGSKQDAVVEMLQRRQAVAPQLGPPQVVGLPLSDSAYLTFGNFLHLPQTKALFGMTGDATNLLAALTNEREFVLARANAVSGKAQKAQWRKLLAQYVRRAYLGDERGLLYWRRIAKLIWVAYENMLRLKTWAARAREGEMARIARWQARAAKERARQKDRRVGAKAA